MLCMQAAIRLLMRATYHGWFSFPQNRSYPKSYRNLIVGYKDPRNVRNIVDILDKSKCSESEYNANYNV